ncbi:MAG: hypothetical protein WC511_06405 [Candidatus Pacearchaeota archaeon]|jgi:hypothetical protein
MEEVTTVKPVVNEWINYLKMRRGEQIEFLEKLIIQGRLSKAFKGGHLVFSEKDGGIIYNPSLADDRIVYFIFEKDAIDFIKAMRERVNDNFLRPRLCNGGCNH